ncbi:anti-sigma factor domain-containing protein [Peribacillus alkalitolerans]|uniref:anti-sigma factor domain-containing protein n=1 Tax=Peribacillus alkalitolerans TaxID=1550385 RepID=UPI0013D5C7CE|nr:anti-sigma factor domain-containing protein [Peribacillus alkalitolerans]
MRKGIIMEVDNHFVTLLTPEGEFLKTKKTYRDRPYMVGEEIAFSPMMQKKVNKWIHYSGPKTLIAGMVACLILFFSLFPAFNQDEVYAYMTIEENPGVEMALDEDLNVIKLRALNKEGKSIISGIEEWEDKSATAVSQLILNSMKDNGYLKNPDQVILSTVGLKDKEKKEQLVLSVQKSLPVTSEVTVVEATKKERKIAKKQGVSTGQYVKSKTVEKAKQVIKKEPQTKSAPSTTNKVDKNIPVNQSSVPNQKENVKKDLHPGKPATGTNPRSNDKNHSNKNDKPRGNDSHSNGKQEEKGSYDHGEKKSSHVKTKGKSDKNDKMSQNRSKNYHHNNGKQNNNYDRDDDDKDSDRDKKKYYNQD